MHGSHMHVATVGYKKSRVAHSRAKAATRNGLPKSHVPAQFRHLPSPINPRPGRPRHLPRREQPRPRSRRGKPEVCAKSRAARTTNAVLCRGTEKKHCVREVARCFRRAAHGNELAHQTRIACFLLGGCPSNSFFYHICYSARARTKNVCASMLSTTS